MTALPNLGRRGANRPSMLEERLFELERAVARIPSRYLNGPPEYTSQIVTQGSHGFAVGDWVGLTGTTWAKAVASSTNAYKALGVVKLVVDAATVEVVLHGRVRIPSYTLTDWTGYYLSTTAGTVASAAPAKPNWRIPLAQSYLDHWIYVNGYPWTGSNQERLSDLLDVDSTTVAAPSNLDLLSYDTASTSWKATTAIVALGSRLARSVIGRSANSAGAAADIQASSTGDVLYMGASSLVWGQLGTASYQSASVTAAKLGSDVVLDTLNDVTITSVANLDFLRYNGSAWVNTSLGEIAWTSGTREFALDGGSGASAASVVGIGKTNSRLLVAAVCSLDFLLAGAVGSGTDISARIRATATNGPIAFYDHATSTFASGDEVMEWGTSGTASSRYFRYLIPLHVLDTGTKNLVLKGTTAQTWTLGDDIGPSTWFTFYGASADSYGNRVKIPTLDFGQAGGGTIYGDRSNGTSSSRIALGSTDGTYYQSGNLSISAGTLLSILGTGSTGVKIGGATSEKIGFWGATPTAKTTVADPSAITTFQTAGATYGATEQAMLNALKADVIALKATLLNVTDAGQAVGLF